MEGIGIFHVFPVNTLCIVNNNSNRDRAIWIAKYPESQHGGV